MFIFPGIALAHVWANQTPFTNAALAGFYIAIVVIPHMAAALGWMDSWLDLRKRWIQPTNGTGPG
jgi:UDP-N-acetylmuramyl pentapeptide phosphotransferase/UDP-N-acetylglucosamine-1-phosphate transferase